MVRLRFATTAERLVMSNVVNSIAQVMEFLGNLLKLIRWGNLPNLQPFVEGNEPKRIAAEFEKFAANGFRMVQENATSLGKVPNRSKPVDSTIDLATGTCRFDVDFGKGLGEMIAAGQYYKTDSDITYGRFPIPFGRVAVDAKLFHFGRNIDSDEVERELKVAGYRSATITELLAFGARFQNEQRRYPIVALGSSTTLSGRRRYPVLYWHGGRSLNLSDGSDRWDGFCRFLGVHIM